MVPTSQSQSVILNSIFLSNWRFVPAKMMQQQACAIIWHRAGVGDWGVEGAPGEGLSQDIAATASDAHLKLPRFQVKDSLADLLFEASPKYTLIPCEMLASCSRE